MGVEQFLAGMDTGLIFGEGLPTLLLLYLERHLPNNPFLLRVEFEPWRSSDIVWSEPYRTEKEGKKQMKCCVFHTWYEWNISCKFCFSQLQCQKVHNPSHATEDPGLFFQMASQSKVCHRKSWPKKKKIWRINQDILNDIKR